MQPNIRQGVAMVNAKSNALTVSMAQYRQRFGHLRCPSLLQAHAFAEHVAAAHSWYKHLHVKSGYGGFAFYLDPHVGKDIWEDQDGELRIVPRLPGDTPLHYSWMTTEATIGNFAYVNYCRYVPGKTSLPWIVDEDQLISVPNELLQQTYVECTALIHPHSQSLKHMSGLLGYRHRTDKNVLVGTQTPEEQRLGDILRLAYDDASRIHDLQDEYAGIVAGIRNRQIAGMVNAIAQLGKLMSGECRNA